MKLYDRYFFRIGLANIGVALIAITLLYVIIDYLAGLDYAGANPRSTTELLTLYLFRLPPILYAIGPVIVLMGGMFALSRLMRNSELLPLRVAGVRTWRALGAFWVLALAAAMSMFLLRELVIPPLSEQAATLTGMYGKSSRGKQVTLRDGRDNAWWIGAYSLSDETPWMERVTVDLVDEAGSVTHVLNAQRFEWRDGAWRGEYSLFTMDALSKPGVEAPLSRHVGDPLPARLDLTPARIARRDSGVELSFGATWDRASADPSRTDLRFEAYQLITIPLTCLSLLMIGVVAAIRMDVRNLFIGGAVALGVALASYTATFIGSALAGRGTLSPEVAAFGPALLLLALGVLGLRMRAD